LLELASEVRSAIEALSCQRDTAVRDIEDFLRTKGCETRYRFPHNWCDFAACVLAGHIARDLRGSVPVYVVRASEIESGAQHWWVRYGDVDIDISCDQFADAPSGVIVEAKSGWHA